MTEDAVKALMEKMQQTMTDQIQKVMTDTAAEMSKLQTAAEEDKAVIQNLQNDLAGIRPAEDKGAKQIDELAQEIQQVKEQTADEVYKLQKAAESDKAQIAALMSELEDIKPVIDETEIARQQQVLEKKRDIQQLENEKGNLTEQLAEVDTQLNTAQAELDVLQGGYKQVEDHIVRFDCKTGEERLDITFGEDLTPKALKCFIAQYSLVKKVNMSKKIVLWDDSEHRAHKVRLALRGEAAEYVNAEDSMLKEWTNDDVMVLDALKKRYLNTQSREVKIIEFESLKQEGSQTLSEYLTQVQQLVQIAYPNEPEETTRRRVVWTFLNGLRNLEIRASIIKEGWVINDEKTKDPEEILKIAESARQVNEAAKATGKRGTGAACYFGEREEAGSVALYSQPSTRSMKCWYCKKEHEGGWYTCKQRLRDAPEWTPKSRKTDHAPKSEKKNFH